MHCLRRRRSSLILNPTNTVNTELKSLDWHVHRNVTNVRSFLHIFSSYYGWRAVLISCTVCPPVTLSVFCPQSLFVRSAWLSNIAINSPKQHQYYNSQFPKERCRGSLATHFYTHSMYASPLRVSHTENNSDMNQDHLPGNTPPTPPSTTYRYCNQFVSVIETLYVYCAVRSEHLILLYGIHSHAGLCYSHHIYTQSCGHKPIIITIYAILHSPFKA